MTGVTEIRATEITPARSSPVVLAPLRAQDAADLADRAVRGEGRAKRRQQVRGAARRLADGGERPLGLGRVPAGPHLAGACQLPLDRFRVEPVQLDPLVLLLGEGVDADDRAPARLDVARPLVGRSLDLALNPAGLDRGDRAAELVDPRDQLDRARLELVA